jgi:hypothetical protein
LARYLRRGTSLRGYTQRSEPVSTRKCRLLDISIMKRRSVLEQTSAAGGVCCVSFLAGCRCRGAYTSALLPRSGDGTSRGWVRCRLGRGTSVWSAIPGAGVWIPRAGTRVPGAVGKVPEDGVETVLLGAECRHLAREVVDLLQMCGVVGRWTNASKRRLGCHLGDAVRTACCGVQASLLLTGENGLYVGG